MPEMLSEQLWNIEEKRGLPRQQPRVPTIDDATPEDVVKRAARETKSLQRRIKELEEQLSQAKRELAFWNAIPTSEQTSG